MSKLKSIFYSTIGEYYNCASIFDFLKDNTQELYYLDLKSRFRKDLDKTTLFIYKNGKIVREFKLVTAGPKILDKFAAFQHIIFFINTLQALFISYKYRKFRKINAAITTFSVIGLATVICKKLGFCKTTVIWHWDYMPMTKEHKKSLLRYVDPLDRLVISLSDHAWYASKAQLDIRYKVGHITDINNKKHKVVHWANNTKINKPKTLDVNNEKIKIIYFGATLPEKGLMEVVESSKELTNLTNKNLEITLAGHSNDKKFKDEIVNYINKNKLNNFVKFYGPATEKEKDLLLRESHLSVALYPKKVNGVKNYAHYSDPAKLRDYIAYGLPIIISDVPELSNELEKNNAAILVKNITTQSVSKAFEQFIQNPNKYLKGVYEFSKTDNYKTYYYNQFKNL